MPRKSELQIAVEKLDIRCDMIEQKPTPPTKGELNGFIVVAREVIAEYWQEQERQNNE